MLAGRAGTGFENATRRHKQDDGMRADFLAVAARYPVPTRAQQHPDLFPALWPPLVSGIPAPGATG